MDNWAIKYEDAKISDLLPPNPNELKELSTFDDRRIMKEYESMSPSQDTLSHVEQLLLVHNFLDNEMNYAEKISNLDEYGVDKALKYATHFKKVMYFYSNNKIKAVQLMNAKAESIKRFKEQYEKGNISSFVNDLYLSPNPNLTDKNTSKPIEKSKKILYKLEHRFIEPLNRDELNEGKEIIDYLKICRFNFGTEPNMLLFDEKLLKNFSIRLLATLYKDIVFLVEDTTKKIIFIGGADINDIFD